MDKEAKIKAYIHRLKCVQNKQLVEMFNLSLSSVKRVLNRLEAQGEVVRFAGGVNSAKYLHEHDIALQRYDLFGDEKETIAKQASQYVKDKDTIILLGGTTVYRMCQYLKGKELTLITNSLLVFDELKHEPKIDIILLGGRYKEAEAELSGLLRLAERDQPLCDHVFMGVSGYVRRSGFSTSDLDSIDLYAWCMRVAKQTYVLMDHSKLAIRGKGITAKLSEVDVLITDDQADGAIVKEIIEMDTKVILAKETNK